MTSASLPRDKRQRLIEKKCFKGNNIFVAIDHIYTSNGASMPLLSLHAAMPRRAAMPLLEAMRQCRCMRQCIMRQCRLTRQCRFMRSCGNAAESKTNTAMRLKCAAMLLLMCGSAASNACDKSMRQCRLKRCGNAAIYIYIDIIYVYEEYMLIY